METTEKTTGLVTEEMGFRRIAMTKCLKSTHRNKAQGSPSQTCQSMDLTRGWVSQRLWLISSGRRDHHVSQLIPDVVSFPYSIELDTLWFVMTRPKALARGPK
jgi:hypothetical protein